MFGDRIKQERRKANLTQEQLANLIGVSPSTIGMYEQNRREPDRDILVNLANYFGVSTDYLLCRSNLRKALVDAGSDNTFQYYVNDDAAELAQEIFEDPSLRILMNASRKLSKQDLEALIKIVKSMKTED